MCFVQYGLLVFFTNTHFLFSSSWQRRPFHGSSPRRLLQQRLLLQPWTVLHGPLRHIQLRINHVHGESAEQVISDGMSFERKKCAEECIFSFETNIVWQERYVVTCSLLNLFKRFWFSTALKSIILTIFLSLIIILLPFPFLDMERAVWNTITHLGRSTFLARKRKQKNNNSLKSFFVRYMNAKRRHENSIFSDS